MKNYDYLTEVKNSYDNKVTGKNIRKSLKKEFPDIKFSVRYSSFAGGDAFDVTYTNGVQSSKVEDVVDKFQRYKNKTNKYFRDIYGSADYVQVNRRISSEKFNAEKAKVLEDYKGLQKDEVFPTIYDLQEKYGICSNRLDYKNKGWVNVDVIANNRLFYTDL